MTPLMLAMAMTLGADDKTAAPNIDGKWLIVYAEENSRRNTTWEQKVATGKGETLSYSKEGEQRALHLKFGPHQTLKASLAVGEKASGDGKAMGGVFIAGQDYLCLSLNHGAKEGGDARATEGAKSSGAFILILRRQR